MKKTIISFFALLLVAQFTWAAAVTPAADIPQYYDNLGGLSGKSLFDAVQTDLLKGSPSMSYSGLWSAYAKSDVYPSDSVGKAGKIWDMYGGCIFTYSTNQCGNYDVECDCYNREHSIPKSWFGGAESSPGADLLHIVPTDGKVNGMRSNYAFGEVLNATYSYNGSKLGTSVTSLSTDKKTIAAEAGVSVSASGTVFEPINQYKGDFARGYMATMVRWAGKYQTFTSGDGAKIFSDGYTEAKKYGLTAYGVTLLMKWHREDPVSQKEIDRNNGIQETQGNRNPFIDYPYLAEFIWGEHAGETVDMSLLMPSTDPDFVPGVSNGWRGGDAPPTPVTKYGVTWSANGIETSVDSVAENSKIAALPETPISCSQESNVFMGWTTAPISGTTDNAPAVLYTKLADFPAVIEDITYYAVFARAETVEYGPQLGDVAFTFEANKFSYEDDGVTIVFDKANGNNEPKFYDPAMRAYAKNTITVTADGITQVVFAFAANDGSNAITPNVGEFATNTWTGNADEVVFTIGGTSGHRKISSMTVTRNGTGDGEIYSRYITSCQDPTEVVEVLVRDASARKILIGGQIYILREGVVYTLTGSRIK